MRKLRKDGGQVVAILALSLLSVLSVAGLAVDLGQARQQQRWAQSIADLSSLGGAELFANARGIGTANLIDSVRTRAHDAVLANGFTDADIEEGWFPSTGTNTENRGGIQVGTFPTGGPFTAGIVAPNSVRVRLRRTVPTFFARVMGASSTSPYVSAVAGVGPGGEQECVLPFAVDPGNISTGGVPKAVPFTFTTTTSSGNWGEIRDPAHPNSIVDALNGVNCGMDLSVGSTPPSDNGNITQINNAFNNHIGQSYVIPVSVVPSPSGNFNILGFVRGTVISSSKSGSNLFTTFTITEYVAGGGNPTSSPPPGSFGWTRYLLQ